MPKLVIFNGPTGIGKDRTRDKAHIWCKNNNLRVERRAMSDSFKQGMHRTFGLSYDPAYYDRGEQREYKDKVHGKLLGRTLREGYIDYSKALKAVFGDDVFGIIYANHICNTKNVDIYLADGGIANEWYPVIDYIGASNVMVVELQGTIEFDVDDYRSYIGEKLKGVYPALTLRRFDVKLLNSSDEDDKMLFNIMLDGAMQKFVGI